jgi:hypothetical protein
MFRTWDKNKMIPITNNLPIFISMTKTIQYPYSIKFSIASIVLMIVLLLLMLSNVIGAHNTLAWIVFGIFSVLFLAMFTMLIMKRLIPSLKGDIAFELDEQGMNDYIRDVSIGWKDIKAINLVRGRSAATMRIDLKWESDYGNQIAIPLRWIKGKDQQIYETVMAYFEQQHSAGTE